MKTYISAEQETAVSNWDISRNELCETLWVTNLFYDAKGTYFIK